MAQSACIDVSTMNKTAAKSAVVLLEFTQTEVLGLLLVTSNKLNTAVMSTAADRGQSDGSQSEQ